MAGARKHQDDIREPKEEIDRIMEQLDRWKVPRRSTSLGGGAGLPMTPLGRIRQMRNVAVQTVAALRTENERLQRLLDGREEETWPFPRA